MTDVTSAQRISWMRQWRNAAPALERVRLDELSTASLARIAADLDDGCIAAGRIVSSLN